MTANRYALTLGEQSEVHVRCSIYGNGLVEHRFTVEELRKMGASFGDQAQLVVLSESDALPELHRSDNDAAMLIIKGRRGHSDEAPR